ncbi:MAG: hypothetical protein H6702_19970 [Myxococcales bacterium]|nr:hypothetical protein [Myxococcales bacterium]
MNWPKSLKPLAPLLAVTLAAGCSSEEDVGAGGLALTVSGGEAARVGFPHREGEVDHAFVDGWQVTFERYVLVLGAVQLSDPSGSVEGTFAGPVAVDLVAGGGAAQPLATLEGLPATRLDVGFELQAAREGISGTAAPEDVAQMAAEGWSALIAGQASKGGRTITFELGFATPARYARCTNGVDNTRGLVIENNKTTGAQLNAHAVHLFWDKIGTDATLRFDPFAAVAGDDDHLTADELAQQDLNDLRDADGERLLDEGGEPLFFYDDVGNLTRDETDLRAFVAEQIRLSLHLNGLGLCTYTRL